VQTVVDDLQRRLARSLLEAVRGSVHRATHTARPRQREIDWDRTIRMNLKHYLPERRTVVLERLIGHGHRRTSLRDIVLCVDQSGSMAASVVYAGVCGAVLASVRTLSTRMVVFDTAVVDLTADLTDPVDLLFGVQLGGGTDINRALAHCQGVITRPQQTILVLITDLHEGGNAGEMLRRAASLAHAGVQVICLLALRDEGAPGFNGQLAASLTALGIPAFACTPDLFPELMAAAIGRRDLGMWAAQSGIVAARR
jgi:Mg-chelatase subunit ChlD